MTADTIAANEPVAVSSGSADNFLPMVAPQMFCAHWWRHKSSSGVEMREVDEAWPDRTELKRAYSELVGTACSVRERDRSAHLLSLAG